MILYLYVIICIAVVVWAVFKLIQIDKEYKRCLKRIDEWFQSESKRREWIPCIERLPERYGWYLCTLKDNRVNCYYWRKNEWVDNRKKHFFDLYNIRSRCTGEEINAEQEGSVYWTDWVIAWMPLPEPYREDGEE